MTEQELIKYENILLDMGVSEEALTLVISINGFSYETLCDILYQVSGYRTFDQLEDIERECDL